MRCLDCLQGDIKNVDDILSRYHGVCIKNRVRRRGHNPQDYRPELDITNELDVDGSIRYHQFIRTLIWVIELGHIYINTELIFLLQQL